MKILVGLILGASLGAVIGWRGRCASGACPLTSNPFIGGVYGALLGAAFAGLLSCSPGSRIHRSVTGGNEANMVSGSHELANVINLAEEAAFEKAVLNSPVPVVVDFWAPWCPPCRLQGSILEELAERHSDQVRVVKVNTDELQGLARRFEIEAIPTLIIFDQSRQKTRLVGLQSREQLEKALDL